MNKSTRKMTKPHTTDTSVGTKESIKGKCPPDLTQAVKDSFLEEINIFDVAAANKEAEKSAAGGHTVDAYSSWLDQHGGQEPPEANPDIVSEDDSLHYITSEKDDDETRLLTEFRQVLSTRELQVWNLVMKHVLSIKKAGNLLGISKGTVQSYLKTAKVKFRKFMEARK